MKRLVTVWGLPGGAILALLAIFGSASAAELTSPSPPAQRANPMGTPSRVAVVTTTYRAEAVASPRITIHDYQFSAKMLTVPVGTAVTWINQDAEPHTVTSSTGLFSSPGLDSGDAFSYRFTAPGTYDYYCALHPHMTATIMVR